MGAFESYLASIMGVMDNLVPFGGVITPTAKEGAIALAVQIRGGSFTVPDTDTLADIPFEILQLGMTITVNEFTSGGGKVNPRTRYYLYAMPPDNTRVSEVTDYLIANYWRIDNDNQQFAAEVEVQYAPNYQGQRPLFLSTQISFDAYQAGYPTTAAFEGGDPSDKIWSDTFTNDALWSRQRLAGQSWGIPVSINQGNYSAGQYIDVIFLWQTKGNPFPQRPVQPNDSSQLPVGWQATPGSSYSTQILTQDLYRSQAVRNAYGVLQTDWDLPILVSTDPQLTRYGNNPGNTDFLNDTYWRGYYTPGQDTFQATRPNGSSTDWTVSKIDQESGEYTELVFKLFPIGVQQSDLIAATPTAPEPLTGVYPNDWLDAPPAADTLTVVYMSRATKYVDGSLKKPWSVPTRFDGLDTIQALIDVAPGDTFYQTRDSSGNLVLSFSTISLTARLYKGQDEVTSGITAYNWYYGTTLIIWSSLTNQPTNLGGLNTSITATSDRKTITIGPAAVTNSQIFKVGITHPSRMTDYENTVQLFDSTDDGLGFVADIQQVSGSVFKNNTGLYQFNGAFYKGGVADTSGVVFTWSIQDTGGSPLTGALRNSGGSSIGDTNVAANSVYVNGTDIPQYAVLILTATFGAVVRIYRLTLTNVVDAVAMETLYWGTGTSDPGPPTDFSPRTLTTADVLALAIGYTATATGTWYMIQRIAGVWTQPIQMRAESARPNGGIAISIWKNVNFGTDGAPTAPAIPSSGSLIPAGWTATPTAFTGGQDTTYMSQAFFLLRTDVNADPTILTTDNYTPVGANYGAPVRLTGIPGGGTGADGTNGWSPVFAIADNGTGGRVLQLVDWVGGTGTKPSAGGTVSYVGATGLTTIGNAINIKGDPGSNATVAPSYFNQVGSATSTAATIISNLIGWYQVNSISIINTWTSARNFLVQAEVGCRGNGVKNYAVRIDQVNDVGVTTTGIDLNEEEPPTASFTGSGTKVKVMAVIQVPAGKTYTINLKVNVDDIQGYVNGGRITVLGM